MSISSISSTNNYYNNISTGRKVNSAADDAAGIAISEKLTSQINGYNKGNQNALDAQNLLKTADGSLDTITDNLQRIRELALQSKNAVYTNKDRSYIQNEINELKKGIEDSINNSSFNTKNLLDGSTGNMYFAVSPNGDGYNTSLGNAVLESLGIADFDVTEEFDINDIDAALDTVSSIRSNAGASYNALDYIVSSNTNTFANLQSANSNIIDADIAKYVSDMKKNEVLDYYKLFMQKKNQEENNNITMKFFTMI